MMMRSAGSRLRCKFGGRRAQKCGRGEKEEEEEEGNWNNRKCRFQPATLRAPYKSPKWLETDASGGPTPTRISLRLWRFLSSSGVKFMSIIIIIIITIIASVFVA